MLAVCAFALALPIIGGTKAQPNIVTVSVMQVAQIDNLDKDFLKADRADFYAEVLIDGQWTRTSVWHGQDVLRPGWRITNIVWGDTTTIRIRLFDFDTGSSGRDDWCDINPLRGERELTLVYNTVNGRITGDVNGYRGEPLTVKGSGDGMRAEITFTINHL